MQPSNAGAASQRAVPEGVAMPAARRTEPPFKAPEQSTMGRAMSHGDIRAASKRYGMGR
jgi:hypothetical protein